jgi:predicted dehydrogenase
VPEPVNVALVGYGLGGSVFHAPLIDATPRLSLTTIVTSNPERRAAIGSRYPGVEVLPSVDALWEGGREWDLVVVSVPNADHFAIAAAALEAGSCTVVDKPITTSSEQGERLAQIAEAHGISVIPYHNRRWDGDFLTIQDLVADGRLGQLWRFESRFERWKPDAPVSPSWKQDPDRAGGGILWDLGSHLIDQALRLFGPPTQVYAELFWHSSVVDDDAFVALAYRNGPTVHLWASTKAANFGPRFRLLGSERAFLKFGLDPQEDALRAEGSPSDPGWGEEPMEAWGTLGTPDGSETVPTRPGAYQDFYAGVADHLLEGAPPPVDVRDAIAGLRIIEAAERSAASGRVEPFT